MTYKNGVTYSGTFAGISVTFTLSNFTPAVTETFNKLLAERAVQYVKENERVHEPARV